MTPEQVAAITTLIDWGSRLGFTSGLVVIVVGFLRGWWYSGAQYRREEAEKNMWRGVALENLDLIKRSASVNEKLTGGPQ